MVFVIFVFVGGDVITNTATVGIAFYCSCQHGSFYSSVTALLPTKPVSAINFKIHFPCSLS
jgi:hypothetical protein